MKVGAPFNPYRVFQGSFAPYWLLEHRGIGAGAKLCYIRLLGFAGKDARCYPSLETLGVSDRQARDYVKELERQGVIAIEQRGLRKTNVYLFVWTAELERLVNAVPDGLADPDEIENDFPQGSPPDRKYPAGPIGINSAGISSLESSSSPRGMGASSPKARTTQDQSTDATSAVALDARNGLAGAITR